MEIAESNVLTLRVIAPADSTQDKARAFWALGKTPYQESKLDELEKIFATEGTKNSKLVVLIKIDRNTRYKYMVSIIDQLQFAELNRFSLAPLTPAEEKEVEVL